MIQFITCCRSTVGVSSGEFGASVAAGVVVKPRDPARALVGREKPSARGEMSSCTCFNRSISAAVREAEVGSSSRLGGAPPRVELVVGRLDPPVELLGIFTERFGRQLPPDAALGVDDGVSRLAFRELLPPGSSSDARLRFPADGASSASSWRCSSFLTRTAWRFFTALSVRPPTMRAISVHLLPCIR